MPQRRLNRFIFAAVTVLIVAAAVRLAVHDFFGLDGDDMFSLLVAANPPTKIISLMMSMQLDVHPPLHFLVLKGWIALTSNGLLALRTMNLLLDLPIGALLIRLTGQSFGRRAALIADILWALCLVLVFADYLVRMYTMLALWSTVGLACVVQAQRVQGTRRIGWLAGAAFQPRVRITNKFGQVFGSELSASDGADLWHRMPVSTWQPGQIWQAISIVNLNPATPPGVYNVEVTVLDPATNQPLSASGKDSGASWVIAGHFTVNATP